MGLAVEGTRRDLLLQLVPLAVIAVGMYALQLFMPRLIPTPPEVVTAFYRMVQSGEIFVATYHAMYAILIGYLLAIVVGVSLGVGMGVSKTTEALADPYVTALYVTPFAALIPAMVLWFGTGLRIRIITCFFFAVLPIAINCMEGAKTTPTELLDVGRSFGAGPLFLMRKVVIPHEIPYIIAGLRLGIGRAVKGLVVTEILISVSGFGQLIALYGSALQMDGVFSVVIVLMLMGVSLVYVLRWVEDRVVYWEPADRA